MSQCLVAGIDPGLTGCVAFLFADPENNAPVIWPLPKDEIHNETDFMALSALLESYNPALVCIEKPTGTPSPGTALKLGQSLGTAVSAALSARFRVVRVNPSTWQAVLLPGEADTKTESLAVARQLYPDANLGRGKGDHNRSDALLIAHYALLGYTSNG